MELLKISTEWFMTPYLQKVNIRLNGNDIFINDKPFKFTVLENKIIINHETYIYRHNDKTLAIFDNGNISFLY